MNPPVTLEMRAARHAALGDPARLGDRRRAVRVGSGAGRAAPPARHGIEPAGPPPRRPRAGRADRTVAFERRRSAPLRASAARRARGPRARSPHPGRCAALFVCSANSARSQLAAALWRQAHRRTGRPRPEPIPPTGSIPAPWPPPAGPGSTSQGPRPTTWPTIEALPALVVTVCDRAHEELDPDDTWLHWSIPDPVPVGTKAAFDAALAELRDRIRHGRRVGGGVVTDELHPSDARARPSRSRPAPVSSAST